MAIIQQELRDFIRKQDNINDLCSTKKIAAQVAVSPIAGDKNNSTFI
jgi:hypothetical protein